MNKETSDLILEAASEITGLRAQLKTAAVQLQQATLQAKTATDHSAADLAPLAKQAADALFDRGMLANEERRDQMAATLTDPRKALAALAKTAARVEVPTTGRVVVDDSPSMSPTADDVWNNHISQLAH